MFQLQSLLENLPIWQFLQAQDVKIAVNKLKEKGVTQAETLPRDYRPWGRYESIASGPRFRVKRIVVNPGAALSLQSHNHRSEHWIMVEGTANTGDAAPFPGGTTK